MGGFSSFFGGGDRKKTQNSGKSYYDLPDWYKDTIRENVERARDISLNPFERYPTEDRFSPLTQDELRAFEEFRTARDMGLPYITEGAELLSNAGGRGFSGPTYSNIQSFMNPFQQAYTDVRKRKAVEDFDNARRNILSQAAFSDAFGGSGRYLLEAKNYENLQDRWGDIQKEDLAKNFYNAQNQLNIANQLGLQAGSQLGAMGRNLQDYGLRSAKALLGSGQLQRGYEQQKKDFDFSEFMREYQQPYQQTRFLSNILSGVNLDMFPRYGQGTKTSETQGNVGAGILDLALGAFSLFSEGGEVKAGVEDLVKSKSNPFVGLLKLISDVSHNKSNPFSAADFLKSIRELSLKNSNGIISSTLADALRDYDPELDILGGSKFSEGGRVINDKGSVWDAIKDFGRDTFDKILNPFETLDGMQKEELKAYGLGEDEIKNADRGYLKDYLENPLSVDVQAEGTRLERLKDYAGAAPEAIAKIGLLPFGLGAKAGEYVAEKGNALAEWLNTDPDKEKANGAPVSNESVPERRQEVKPVVDKDGISWITPEEDYIRNKRNAAELWDTLKTDLDVALHERRLAEKKAQAALDKEKMERMRDAIISTKGGIGTKLIAGLQAYNTTERALGQEAQERQQAALKNQKMLLEQEKLASEIKKNEAELNETLRELSERSRSELGLTDKEIIDYAMSIEKSLIEASQIPGAMPVTPQVIAERLIALGIPESDVNRIFKVIGPLESKSELPPNFVLEN